MKGAWKIVTPARTQLFVPFRHPYTPQSHQPIKTQNSPFWSYMVQKPNRRPHVLVQRTYTDRSIERFCSIPLVSETVKRSISVTIFRPLNRKTMKQPRSVKFYPKESQSTCRMGSTPDLISCFLTSFAPSIRFSGYVFSLLWRFLVLTEWTFQMPRATDRGSNLSIVKFPPVVSVLVFHHG